MKTYRWKTIKSVLSRMPRPVPEQNAETFWSEFRTQALKHTAPESIETIRHPIAMPFKLVVITGFTVAALVLLVAVRTFIVVAKPNMAMIKSLKIHTRHHAVFLVNDVPRRTTILWISGIEE